MKKIVISKCHGGFGVSRKAFLRLRELGCEEATKEPDYGEFYSDGSGPREDYGLSDSFGTDLKRDCKLLVQVVKEMGKDANGRFASLSIVEIPDDAKWEIDEYDGYEHVAEKHRTWG